MHNCYLLLGAGFSRNWGGWLGAEVFEYLIGHRSIRDDPTTRQLLWRFQATVGFEGALAEAQAMRERHEPDADRVLLSLMTALRDMFREMNEALHLRRFEFTPRDRERPLSDFLRRFSAIFTLNQDALLESKYLALSNPGDSHNESMIERGWTFPGMRLVLDDAASRRLPKEFGTWVPADTREIASDRQPIFKLHGSSKWRESESSDLMILGGGKAAAIRQSVLLNWYSEEFSRMLFRPNSRLMIIGYGFRDPHINQIVLSAMRQGLKTFVVDPLGHDAARSTNSLLPGVVGYRLSEFEEVWRDSLIGASRRALSETFGTDEVERSKLEGFLA